MAKEEFDNDDYQDQFLQFEILVYDLPIRIEKGLA